MRPTYLQTMRVMLAAIVVLFATLQSFAQGACTSTAQNGGPCGGNVCCPSGQCCSQYNFCGITAAHCGTGCQPSFGLCGLPSPKPVSPTPLPSFPQGTVSTAVQALISRDMWLKFFGSRPPNCPGIGFYTYNRFLRAASFYPKFATEGTPEQNKREIAAFLAQVSQETFGAPYTGGLCWIREGDFGSGPTSAVYCDPTNYPCADGKRYFGRGPMQISWNYNYAQLGSAVKLDLINNPNWIAMDGVLSFRSALWFWMTPQSPKPSCHDVILGRNTITQADQTAGRQYGFGWTTNIINGGIECNQPVQLAQRHRIEFFTAYCGNMSISTGSALNCANQKSY